MAGQRRRGEELETALLEAAWEELVEAGFAKLTMESVAARARTGVAVLYRRWPRKDDLALAALWHYGKTRPVDIPDTGSLRGDMLALMDAVGEQRRTLMTVISAVFAGLQASSGLTPAEARDRVMGDRPLWSHEIFRRAHERGEINLDTIPRAVLTMPFDLMRHDLLMTLSPVPEKRILEIVDDLFLPLVAKYQAGQTRGVLLVLSVRTPPKRPEHVLLVAEVVSPGSETTDRIVKSAEYAQAGIRFYWRIELATASSPAVT